MHKTATFLLISLLTIPAIPLSTSTDASWTSIGALPSARWGEPQVTSIGTTVYLLDAYPPEGVQPGQGYGQDITLALTASGWETRAPMPRPVTAFGLAAFNGAIYVAGGGDIGDLTFSTFQAYDTASDTWHLLPSMPYSVKRLAAIAHAGSIWALGGWCNNNCRESRVFAYDPATGAWSSRPDLPWSGDVWVNELGGKLYAYGGWDVTGYHFAVYDDANAHWAELPSPPESWNYGPSLASFAGKLLYLRGDGASTRTWLYDPSANAWSAGPSADAHLGNSVSLADRVIAMSVPTTSGATWGAYALVGSAAYTKTGFLPPIDAGRSGAGCSSFNSGSMIPLKFKLTGASAGRSDLTPKLSWTQVSSLAICLDGKNGASTGKNDRGTTFRYDATEAQYILNWATKGIAPGTYDIMADLGDGEPVTARISLK